MNNLERGDFAEQLFIVEAIKYGLKLSRPLNPSSSYDFIVDNSRRLIKIQVKATFCPPTKTGIYRRQLRRQNKSYGSHDFDFFALYVRGIEGFYVIPFTEISGGWLSVNPSDVRCPFRRFLNNFVQLA